MSDTDTCATCGHERWGHSFWGIPGTICPTPDCDCPAFVEQTGDER